MSRNRKLIDELNGDFIPLILNTMADAEAAHYPVNWTPTTFVLDSEGNVLGKTVGGSLKKIRKMLEEGRKAFP